MLTDSPRKKNRRHRLIEKFSEDWEIDVRDTPTIRYMKKAGLRGIFQKFFGRKHKVIALYYFLNKAYSESHEYLKYKFPVVHDNMPVVGVPTKFTLESSWNITDEDLGYLYEGPFVDQNDDVLVQAYTIIEKMKRCIPYVTLGSGLLGSCYYLLKIMDYF